MHEDLLGYLLGALSADEQRRVEDALASDPQLREELERLRRGLEPLESLDQNLDPPAGLADRTLDAVEHCMDQHRPTPRSVQRQRDSSQGSRKARDGHTSPPRHYSVSDGIVLALVGLAAITMLLPALANSRYESRKDACQNNLRFVGTSLIVDSLKHGGHFIQIPDSGKRAFDGVFACMLVDRQLLPVNSSALLCPGVAWRNEFSSWRIPTLSEIDTARGPELDRLKAMAGGSYSFAVGYTDSSNHYRPILNAGRAYFPILADAPSRHLEDSANHGGRGQNFMFEDGHITFVTRRDNFNLDDPWRNHRGYAEAGNGQNDAVLLRSESPPFVSTSVPSY